MLYVQGLSSTRPTFTSGQLEPSYYLRDEELQQVRYTAGDIKQRHTPLNSSAQTPLRDRLSMAITCLLLFLSMVSYSFPALQEYQSNSPHHRGQSPASL